MQKRPFPAAIIPARETDSQSQLGPSDLLPGELGVNSGDGTLYVRLEDGTVKAVGSAPSQAKPSGVLHGRKHLRRALAKAAAVAHSDPDTATNNLRFAMFILGDSLAGRLTGWLASHLSRLGDVSGGRRGGVFSKGGPIAYGGTGDEPLIDTGFAGDGYGNVGLDEGSGIGDRLTTAYSGGWMNGTVFDITGGQSYYFPGVGQFRLPRCERVLVNYITQPGGGEFVLEQIDGNNTSPGAPGVTWSAISGTISTDGALGGATLTLPVTAGYYGFYFRVRCTGGGTVRLISGGIDWGATASQFVGGVIAQGGISPVSSALTEPAIVTPIMQAAQPDLITIHYDDIGDTAIAAIRQVISNVRDAVPDCSVLVVANHANSNAEKDAAIAANADALIALCDAEEIAVFDAYRALGGYDDLVQYGWIGDGVHLDPKAYSVAGQMLISDLGLSYLDDVTRLRTRLEHVHGVRSLSFGDEPSKFLYDREPTLTITPEKTFGATAYLDINREIVVRKAGSSVEVMKLSWNDNVTANRMPTRLTFPNINNNQPHPSNWRPAPYNNSNQGTDKGVMLWASADRLQATNLTTGQTTTLTTHHARTVISLPAMSAGESVEFDVPVAGALLNTSTVQVGYYEEQPIGVSATLPTGVALAQAAVVAAGTVRVRFACFSAGGSAAGSVGVIVAVTEVAPETFESATQLVVASVPGAPTNVSGYVGPGLTETAFTAPADDGGSAITGYKFYMDGVEVSPEVSGSNYAVFPGDYSGQPFQVSAVNAVGEGPKSDVAIIT